MINHILAGCLLLSLVISTACLSAESNPSVLFYGGIHNKYVVKPLVSMGIDVDVCNDKLSEKLTSSKYNVVIVGTLNESDRATIDDFISKGGGVLVCNPHVTNDKDWTATNEWLSGLGATPRWEVLQDSDPQNVVRDVMGCSLSWSNKIYPPVNEGVNGALTLMWNGTSGCEPPMSFDLSSEWKSVVKGSDSMKSIPDQRQDDYLQKWMPKENGPNSPSLMATRDIGKGRIAVVGIRYYWLFSPPPNCPTTETMLSAGAGGKPSDWLKVFANTFRWLAEPSMKLGIGGTKTPQDLINPPTEVWESLPPLEWKPYGLISEIPDQTQTVGIIGARTSLSSGTGTVRDYVKEAKSAGLQFIVFLEDSLKMDQEKWDRLVQECKDASDKGFAAIPGLTYEDAQGDHLYAFADEVKFPKPNMLLDDGRLATIKDYRTRALFDYVNEYLQQKALTGYWRHKENYIHFADYKLYNSFPVYTFDNGKQVDDAFNEYAYFMGIGGGQAILAFEIMTSPDQVKERAKNGWKVISYRSLDEIRSKWFESAWSFHGMMSQYITNGPKITLWQGPNRLINPNGQWWRPDLSEFRIQIRAESEAGLESVTIYDGGRVLRRWYPNGAKTFEKEIILSNCQQMGIFPVVKDQMGRKAIGMESWNRNCIMEEFFCSDRCNFLGSARLKTRSGQQYWTPVGFQANMGITPSKGSLNVSLQPAVSLTFDSPTLPIDGAPAGYPTVSLHFEPKIPGELDNIFAYPDTYMVSPEIAIGQAQYMLGYDPAEYGAKVTPLGHPYEQPQNGGSGANAWSSWHKLVPTKVATGFVRTYACNWIPETFRIGWFEVNLVTKDILKDTIKTMFADGNQWVIWNGEEIIASPNTGKTRDIPNVFGRRTYATLEHPGGSVMVIGFGDELKYDYDKGTFSLSYNTAIFKENEIPKGKLIDYQIAFVGASSGTTTDNMLDFARKFGVADPGKTAYTLDVKQGRLIDKYLILTLNAEEKGIEAKISKTDLPGFLPVKVEKLNDNWSVYLLDKARPFPNFRALPVRDGSAYAQLDLNDADMDLFIGHPVICDNPSVNITLSWVRSGEWYIEAHNPSNDSAKVNLTTAKGWTIFDFNQSIRLDPGSSQTWLVNEKTPH